MLFNLEYNLCKEFPALSPFDIEVKTYHEVIKLYADMRRIQIHEKDLKDPNRVIRVRAGDDWF